MVAGDLTLTNHGSFAVSGAALATKVSGINITATQFISGARLHFVPIGNGGQIQLLQVSVAA